MHIIKEEMSQRAMHMHMNRAMMVQSLTGQRHGGDEGGKQKKARQQ